MYLGHNDTYTLNIRPENLKVTNFRTLSVLWFSILLVILYLFLDWCCVLFGLGSRWRIVLLVVLFVGLVFRMLVVPFTTGSDIAQFAGFGDSFLRFGLCFYRYDFPGVPGVEWAFPWPYVYGPVFLFVLGLLRLFVGSPVECFWDDSHYYVYVPLDWIVAVKSVFVLFDLMVAILLYVIVRRLGVKESWAVLVFGLYWLNPMTIYISAIYGMFDMIALACFLAGLYLFVKAGSGRKYFYLGLFLAGLSIAVKQTMIYPVFILVLYLLLFSRVGRKKRLIGCLVLFFGGVLPFLPFEIGCPGSLEALLMVMGSVSRPGYTYPIVYSFNGFSSLATFLHDMYGWGLMWVFEYWWVPFTILIVLVVTGFLARRDLYTYIGLSYLVFIATYWRVNHQYLIPTVAFLCILLVRRREKIVRILSLLIIILTGVWPVAFPTSWWAHVHIRHPNEFIVNLLDALSLRIFDQSFYVAYSLVLTIATYLLIIMVVCIDVKRCITARKKRVRIISSRQPLHYTNHA